MPKKKSRGSLDHIAEPLRPLAEPMDAVTPDPQNARGHPEENVAAIMASLRKFGQRKPLVANRRNRQIEAGNATWQAAGLLGWKQIAVVWVEDDPASQTGFALADNRTAETAEWLEEALAAAILAVKADDAELAAALMLDGLAEANDLIVPQFNDPPKSIQQNVDELEAIRLQRQKGNERVADRHDTERYLVVVFPTRAAREQTCKKLGLPDDERYVAAASVRLSARLPGVQEPSGHKTASKRHSGDAG